MNFNYTKPNTDSEKGFFNDFQKLEKPSYYLAFIIQIPLFFSEVIGVTFWVMDAFNIPNFYYALPIGVIVGFLFEGLNYFAIPLALYCLFNWKKILSYKSNNFKVGLIMAWSIITLSALNLPIATYSSYEGSKEAVAYLNKEKIAKAKIESLNKIDSIKNIQDSILQNEYNKNIGQFKEDSASIAKLYKNLRGAEYRTKKSLIRKSIKYEEKDFSDKIEESTAKIIALKAEEQKEIMKMKKSLLSGKEDDIKKMELEIKELEKEEDKQLSELNELIEKSSFLIAIGSIFFQIAFILLHCVIALFNRGSNKTKKILPSNYYYYPNKIQSKAIYLKNKIDGRFYNKLRAKEIKLPNIATPPLREEFFKEDPKIFSITNETGTIKRQINTIEDYKKSESEKDILTAVKKKAVITAKKLISIYLETENEQKIDDFYKQCELYIQKKGANPFRSYSEIGFKKKNNLIGSKSSPTKRFRIMENSAIKAKNTAIGDEMNCISCNKSIKKNAHNQLTCGAPSCQHERQAFVEMTKEKSKIKNPL